MNAVEMSITTVAGDESHYIYIEARRDAILREMRAIDRLAPAAEGTAVSAYLVARRGDLAAECAVIEQLLIAAGRLADKRGRGRASGR